jgi:hypothetical protein
MTRIRKGLIMATTFGRGNSWTDIGVGAFPGSKALFAPTVTIMRVGRLTGGSAANTGREKMHQSRQSLICCAL